MAAPAETMIQRECEPISVDERQLTEVDHLNQHRLADGSYPEAVLADVLSNLKTAVQEGGIPHAVSTTVHEYQTRPGRQGVFMWMGKTAIENAMSGYRFHANQAARKRVDVEVDEARHSQEDLKPGVMKVFISPKMTEKDAPHGVAKREHLADEDAVRVSWLEMDEAGVVQTRVMQSLLVRDVPLKAWVAMLQDPENPFGKTIEVEDPDSATSVMEVHRQLEVPLDALPNGPIGIVEAVVPYISDEAARQKIMGQIKLFNGDQQELDRKAANIARRWLDFEINLADSLYNGKANFEVERFIVGLQSQWNEKDLRVINGHLIGDEYMMSPDIAVILEKAKKNVLWTEAAVISGNQSVIRQIDPAQLQEIRGNAMLLQQASHSYELIRQIEAENGRAIARQNVKVGGGCSGISENNFDELDPTDPDAKQNIAGRKDWKKDPKSWKVGVCRIKSCATRPGSTKVGPCDVCSNCQTSYDKGTDPNRQTPVVKLEKPDFTVTGPILRSIKKPPKPKKELQPA